MIEGVFTSIVVISITGGSTIGIGGLRRLLYMRTATNKDSTNSSIPTIHIAHIRSSHESRIIRFDYSQVILHILV